MLHYVWGIKKLIKMPNKSLSKRKNWQVFAKINGDNGEKHVMNFITGRFNEDWVPISTRTIFKGIFTKLDYNNNFKLRYHTKQLQYVQPDLAYYNTKTEKYVIIEVKNQQAKGNAHERAYKWIALLPLIKKHLKIEYNPMVIIFTGGMCYHEKYITEINSVFPSFPEWVDNWCVEQNMCNKLNKWFPVSHNNQP